MDLQHLVSNRELLERLSREYELLKASGAEVDYPAWVRQRLREAAAELAASVVPHTPEGEHTSGDVAPAAEPVKGPFGRGRPSEAAAAAGPAEDARPALTGRQTEQLFFSRASGIPNVQRQASPLASDSRGGSDAAWLIRGEGAPSAPQTLARAIYGPNRAAPGAAALVGSQRPAKEAKKQKRVIVISPQRSPTRRPPNTAAPQPVRQQPPQVPDAPPISKLYTDVEPGLFTSRPDAYVHPQARPRRTPTAAKRPDWVNAASLQASLRGASAAIPHLQAAAERERRLALSSALARQTLAAGLGPDEARAAALYGAAPAAAAAQAAQYDHVLLVAQQLAQQNEQLARAVQDNSVALAQQKAIIDSALQQRLSQTARDVSAAAGAAAGDTADPPMTSARVEIESGPPPWFASTASGRQAQATRSRSKSPTRRIRSQNLPPLPPAGTTAKELERAARKEQLKTLLKQILGGAGKSSGAEGRRRLATGMAEAEKLVAAIQALARVKAGKGAKGERTSGEPAMPLATPAPTALDAREVGSDGAVLEPTGVAGSGMEPAAASGQATAVAPRGPSRVQSGGSSRAASQGPSRTQSKGASRQPSQGSPPARSQSPSRATSQGPSREPSQGPSRTLSQGPSRTLSQGPSRTLSQAPSRARSQGPQSDSSNAQSHHEEVRRQPSKAQSSERYSGSNTADGSLASAPSSRPMSRQGSGAAAAFAAGVPSSCDAEAVVDGLQAADVRSIGPQTGPEAAADPPSGDASNAGSAAHGSIALAAQAAAAASASGRALRPSAAAPMLITTTTAAAPEGPPRALPRVSPEAHYGAPKPAAVGVPPGLMVESLEDQVQQIVERDAAAYTEVARLRKIDALEQRLHAMVDKVETKLARALQPLQLNLQQRPAQPGAAQTEWAMRFGPDGQPFSELAVENAGLVGAGAAAAGAGHPGATGVSGGGRAGGGGGYADGVTSPHSAALSVLELQRMLIQLNRMESKEQEIRRKWFYDAKVPKPLGFAAQPIVVRDGQVGTLDPAEPSSPPASPRPAQRRATSPRPNGTGLWSFARPPTESALATFAGDSSGSHPCSGGAIAPSVQAQDGSAQAAGPDPISDATLESVLRGRRRFMRAQQLADGDLLASAVPSLNPVQIMEDVTDVLLDEMLREQAKELLSFCDDLGEHVFKDEFNLDDDKT